jgi:uncharacterized membrane protein
MPENDLRPLSGFMEVSGPLPVSSEFAGYEKTLPGAAERILSNAEQESKTRRENETLLVKSTVKMEKRGQLLAFIVQLLSLGGVFASIFLDKPLVSIAPAILAITSLASVYFGNRGPKE